ncbi:MAG TPA: sialidase family protein [Bryobacteraceae bacterium]|nr:sialidase family protein [Bryobacteraceae bacterium]
MRIALLLMIAAAGMAAETASPKHVTVFAEEGRFGGWPANHGMWSWGNELLVGFEVGYFRASDRGHAIDYTRPAEHVLARSLDGGESWKIEKPEGLRPPPGEKVAGVPTGELGKPLRDCPGGIDFTHPNFALTARMTSIHDGVSRYYYSMDRGKSWEGPCRLPDFGQPGMAARTDYLVNSKHDLTMILTAAKSNKKEGRVICVRTRDGGKTWKLVSFVTPEPEGNEYAIMPASVRLDRNTILTAVRYRKFIDTYLSKDDGATWERVGRPAPETGGNPPSILKLRDKRLALVYGRRLEPFGLRARLSSDQGKTWGDEIVLRQDGGTWDLGYPRTAQRADGKLVTVYYYNTKEHQERFIGATIWTP